MTLLKNLGLFLIVFLPVAAIVSMVMAGVLGDGLPPESAWHIGWNPVLWFIMTAPWLLPTALVVPILQLLGSVLGKRLPLGKVRLAMLAASPALFFLAVLALWGPGNLDVDFILPVLVSSVVYGLVLRVRVTPAQE
ncbi:MAG: hypothetical protein ISS31_09160 [Kiritimatiellae bacterium]|nr:hypothetical protein [bacterium]MBL7077629.1 hypothetical protein [Kiritimatiellia bacterium]